MPFSVSRLFRELSVVKTQDFIKQKRHLPPHVWNALQFEPRIFSQSVAIDERGKGTGGLRKGAVPQER